MESPSASRFEQIQQFYISHERPLMSAAFALGLIWDNLTLTRVDLLYDNIVLTLYLLIASASIAAFQAREEGAFRSLSLLYRGSRFLPLLMQFAFGGLFSGYIIYYSKSASLVGGWPFLLFLLALFIGNEAFKKRYHRLTFQLSIFFIACFSYFIFSVPVVLKAMGWWVFILSGLTALAAVSLLVFILFKISPGRLTLVRQPLFISIGTLYLFFNLAYFTNMIPPLPLGLKELDIYHAVTRSEAGYELSYEPAPWYDLFDPVSDTFHRVDGEAVYAYSAVFAPTKLKTQIFHRWAYYDSTRGSWVAAGTIPFSITGGRDGGYRGYSVKESVFPGTWRVDVVTGSGQIIGRKKFDVEEVSETPPLETTVD